MPNNEKRKITSLRVLGLKEGATKKEVEKQFRKLSLQYHPDKHHGTAKDYYANMFLKVNNAKNCILNDDCPDSETWKKNGFCNIAAE